MDADFGTNGIMTRTGDGTYAMLTDNSANWNTAYGWGNHTSAGYLNLSSLSASAPLSYNNTTGAFSVSKSGVITDGYLDATDFNTFNNKQAAISGSTNLTINNITANTSLKLNDADVSAVVTLKAKNDTTASYTLTLPDNDGNSGQVLHTDGTGNLSWISAGGTGDMLSSTFDSTGTAGIVDNAEALGGNAPSYFLNASNIAAGTLGEVRVDAAIARDSEIPALARAALSGSAPVTFNSGTGSIGISAATTAVPGSMSAADKTKLDGITAGANVVNATTVDAATAVMDADFSTNGIMTRTGAGSYSMLTDNSSNWNLAHSERLNWNGGATGLNAATGRTSLGLGSIAEQSAASVAITGGSVAGVSISTANIISTPSSSLVLATGSNDDIAIGAFNNLVITGPGAAFSLTGLTGGVDGRHLRLENNTTSSMSLVNETVSAAANQIKLSFGQTITVGPGQSVSLIYNGAQSRWRIDSSSLSYEEGTFTPTYAGTTTVGSCTYSQQVGRYVRTGKIVNFSISMVWSVCGTAPAGAPFKINGLPYVSRNVAGMQQLIPMMPTNYTSGVTSILAGAIQPNSQSIDIKTITAATLSLNGNAAFDSAATMVVSGTYLVE